jgi:hypothetical protein
MGGGDAVLVADPARALALLGLQDSGSGGGGGAAAEGGGVGCGGGGGGDARPCTARPASARPTTSSSRSRAAIGSFNAAAAAGLLRSQTELAGALASSDSVLVALTAPARATAEALAVASEAGDVAAVGRILAAAGRRFDPDAIRGLHDATPLHHAARRGHGRVARLLLRARADPNARNRDGESPLHLAAYAGDAGLVDMLLAAGGDPGAVTAGLRETPLMFAARRGHGRVVAALLAAGADPAARSRIGDTAGDEAAGEAALVLRDAAAGEGPAPAPPPRAGARALPYDALLSVFAFLEPASLGRAGAVCRRWRAVHDADAPALWAALGVDSGRRLEMSISSALGFGVPPMAMLRPPSGRRLVPGRARVAGAGSAGAEPPTLPSDDPTAF